MANRAWRLKRYPVGLPTVDDFELVAAEPPSSVLADGEVLLRTAFISVDPYMRTRMKAGAGYLMDGFELGGKYLQTSRRTRRNRFGTALWAWSSLAPLCNALTICHDPSLSLS